MLFLAKRIWCTSLKTIPLSSLARENKASIRIWTTFERLLATYWISTFTQSTSNKPWCAMCNPTIKQMSLTQMTQVPIFPTHGTRNWRWWDYSWRLSQLSCIAQQEVGMMMIPQNIMKILFKLLLIHWDAICYLFIMIIIMWLNVSWVFFRASPIHTPPIGFLIWASIHVYPIQHTMLNFFPIPILEMDGIKWETI